MLTFTHKVISNLDSWSEMRKAIKSGHADDFHVGDEIEETLSTGEKVIFVVAAVNLYENNQVIFSMKDCLNDPRPMNNKSTNRGGWAKSDLRKWLNADLFNTLPSDLQDSITPRKFSSTCEDKLWLFSEMEMFGREIFGSSDNGDKQMPLYRRERDRVKEMGEQDTWWYWERSPYGSNTTGFCYVLSTGVADNYNASSTRGVSFGFCI